MHLELVLSEVAVVEERLGTPKTLISKLSGVSGRNVARKLLRSFVVGHAERAFVPFIVRVADLRIKLSF